MKKINILSILALLVLVLFASCDNTGVYDSIWDAEVVTNEDSNNVPGLNGNYIYYLSEVDGLKSYNVENGEITPLNNDITLRRSRAAVFDTTKSYIVSYDGTEFTVVSLDGQKLYKVSNTEGAFNSKIRKGYGSLFYTTDGTYSVTVNTDADALTANLTFNSVHTLNSNISISINSGVYTVYDSNRQVSDYYVVNGFDEGTQAAYTAASFTKNGEAVAAKDLGTFIAATSDQSYMFFNTGSATDIYHAASGSAYTLFKTLSNYSFGAGATNSAKAIETDTTLILMRGNYYLTTSKEASTSSVNPVRAASLSYDTILSVLESGNAGSYYVVTYNSGIHTMTVNDAEHTITLE